METQLNAHNKHEYPPMYIDEYISEIKSCIQNKEELKRIYKATNNAEKQAINDIYNYLANQITPITFLQESPIENSFKIQVNRHIKEGLAPWIGKNPKVLILGTMPSDTSIEQQSYYSNPSNSFWKIMYSLFLKKRIKTKKNT